MSFFGQNNQQNSGFGGFGSNNNSGTGFGQPSNTGFGASSGATTGGGLFGTSNNNNSSGFGGFGATGSTASPFGATNTSGFGANTSSGGGMFGSNTATSGATTGFGGFGGSNANTGGGLFGGGNKPAFGSQPATGGSLFGGPNAFGSSTNQTTTPFGGAPLSSALGSNNTECQGTGSTPFQAFTEKEGATGNQTNHFQSITFMQPYKNFSFEELRLADYNQGRRYGNGSGQAGAFGTSTGFGGFGGQNTAGGFGNNNQSTGMFGAQTSSATPFGGTQTATSGFGANNTGGGLFNSATSKPGSIFGSTASQPTGGGGLFGNSNQSGGFGAQNTTSTGFGSTQGGGGLFDTNNQQKSGFSFGQNNTTGTGFGTSGNAGFGTNNTTNAGSGLFGTNPTNTSFGGGQQQQASNPFGGFGNNQQNQNQNQGNTGSGFGAFGNNDQQKSGGIFGSNNTTSNAGGGLFSNANQNNQQPPATGGGLFGNANNNQAGGTSLFGAKPATTGTGLFGNNNTSNTGNTGGGIFGTNTNNQSQQNQPGGLFGNTNNQQQQKAGGLFGSSTGSGLFGSTNNNQQQGTTQPLFGGLGSNNQQQQSGGLFGNSNNTSSLFGNSQQQQQQQANNPLQAPQAYSASIFDANPYGSRSIFDGLPPPPQQYTGPVATPIGQKEKIKKGAVLPQYRINPHVASRFVTPQKRQGYGFTYSTYGTPSSASSNMSTPGGMNSSLLAGSISRGLGKSLSTSNLRRSFDPDQESLLSPGAFSVGSTRHAGTGSLKKLTIDRSLRTDLFQSPPALPSSERSDQSRQPSILKKKVSFDASTVGGNGDVQNGAQPNGVNGVGEERRSSGNSWNSEQEPSSSTQPNGLLTGPQTEVTSAQPEMEQVRGNELAVISEDGNQDSPSDESSANATQVPERDPQPGNYYMKPSREEIENMSSEQKRQVSDFCIGRENCGYVIFNKPVNLQNFPFDRIFGEIAQIQLRSVTIYPDAQQKPPKGKGLNVPATIYLANSWPRNRFEKHGPRFNKHVQRLQKVQGTEFVTYEKDTGTWVFKVEHFSTYALDYDDEGSEGDTFQSSTLSAPPESPTPRSRLPRAGSTPMPMASMRESSILSSEFSAESSGPDDTFEFRRKKILPGAFDDAAISDEEANDQVMETAEVNDSDRSFVGQRLAASVSTEGEPSDFAGLDHRNSSQNSVVRGKQLDMAGSFPQVDGGPEQENSIPQSLLGATQSINGFGTPGKLEFNEEGDWAEELRRTISPRKQDRQALRESQARVMQHKEDKIEMTPKVSVHQHTAQPGFATTMDLMHSIFPMEQGRRAKGRSERAGQGKAFQYPYPKTLTANGGDYGVMRDDDQRWHDSFKPSWGPTSTFVYATSRNARPYKKSATETNNVLRDSKTTFISEGRDVQFAKLAPTPSLTPNSLSLQKTHTRIAMDQGVPLASPQHIPLIDITSSIKSNSRDERSAWELASILFDKIDSSAFGNISTAHQASYEHRVRKDRLGDFWSSICKENAQKAVTNASSAEERAIDYLSANALVKACQTLIEAKDFRLATLVSQLPADQIMAEDMTSQIHEWRELCVLSELTEPIRALYEICAGNVCICEGKKGPIEDQAKTFVLSQRFGLDWRRAFGLRLWYATKAEAPIEDAIKLFHTDLRSDETVKPTPPFVYNGSEELAWIDDKSTSREDIHWGLLRLFAASKDTVPTQSIADIVLPHNLVGHPLDFRFSFQLYHALAQLFPANTDKAKADQLAWDFAVQLEAQGEWLWSVFILLHLSDPAQRQNALLDILARNAGSIPAPDSAFPFSTLVSDFKIPAPWIWEAKALHARSVLRDHAEEIYYLQKAGNWIEAHATLCGVVGPRCVIEQDFDTLHRLVEGFRRGKDTIEEAWRKGGEIYEGYVEFVVQGEGRCGAETVEKLLHALLESVEEKRGDFGFEEGIAVREIAGSVADVVAKGGYEDLDSERILQLPLTADQYRRHSMATKLKRFENVMKGARNRQLRSP